MVTFNTEKTEFTITFYGNSEDYMCYLRSLASVIAAHDPDLIIKDDIYMVSNLLREMLPSDEQKIKIE